MAEDGRHGSVSLNYPLDDIRLVERYIIIETHRTICADVRTEGAVVPFDS